ncbi:MAG: hypothetical protein EXR95_06040 [Gemmatimonadetes bacterium]|nr:hypothetical protein [Gemmatimonadota bacterium]
MNRSALLSRSIVLAALVAAAEGCASGPRNVMRLDVGRASRPDVVDKVPRILDQQGYEVQERQDTGNVIRYMTSWVTRAPFEDEAARGAQECRTRLTVEARLAAGGTFGVSLSAESTMQRGSFDGAWVNLPPTPMFREHMSAVSEALALEIDMGVRTR